MTVVNDECERNDQTKGDWGQEWGEKPKHFPSILLCRHEATKNLRCETLYCNMLHRIAIYKSTGGTHKKPGARHRSGSGFSLRMTVDVIPSCRDRP